MLTGCIPLRDEYTDAGIVIAFDHHEIHEGDAYSVAYDADVAAGQTLILLIVTPNTTKWCNMLYSCTGEAEATLVFSEGATVSANGTAITARNRNRNVSGASTTLCYHTPTVTNAGTTIDTDHFGSGRQSGGLTRGDNEWLLKQNSKYLVTITSQSVSTAWIRVQLHWYEHTSNEG